LAKNGFEKQIAQQTNTRNLSKVKLFTSNY